MTKPPLREGSEVGDSGRDDVAERPTPLYWRAPVSVRCSQFSSRASGWYQIGIRAEGRVDDGRIPIGGA